MIFVGFRQKPINNNPRQVLELELCEAMVASWKKNVHGVKKIQIKVNTFVEVKEKWERGKVRYYTIQLEGKEKSETDIFESRFGKDLSCQEDYHTLASFLKEIGDRGAKERYFRFENAAHALPPSFVKSKGLRLYCLRLSDEIVILGGGCIKSSQTVEGSPECKAPFRLMGNVAKALTSLIRDGEVWIVGNRLCGELDFEI